MKFLTTTRMRDSYYALPAGKRLEISAANASFIKKYQKAGKCLAMYMMAGMRETVSVWDMASDEEAVQITLETPMFQYADMNVKGVYDIDTVLSAVTKYYKGMATKK